MLRRIIHWLYERHESRRVRRQATAWHRRLSERPSLAFAVGDRVKAIDHRRVDDQGGYGTITALGTADTPFGAAGYRVQFDSFPPDSKFYMAGSELVYARE